MSILIKGMEMPTKHFIKGFYIDGETGNVLDISRKNIIGHAVEISSEDELLLNVMSKDELKNYVSHFVNLPSAEPERKKGKWLLFDGYRCSRCNYKLQTMGIPMYCPNCGADMRGEEDGSNN